MSTGARGFRNSFLRALSFEDYALLRPFLEYVSLKKRELLHDSWKSIEYVHFLETGLGTLRSVAAGKVLGLALIGRGGVAGAAVAFGIDAPMHQCVTIIPGRAIRIRTENLLFCMNERPQIRESLLRYVQALTVNCSQTAFCGAHHGIEPRLACWLSLACDSLEGEVLPVTHEDISLLLGLRRAGVTEALNQLESQRVVQKTRGVLHVKDRSALLKRVCSCYGIISDSYRRAAETRVSCVEGRPQTVRL